MEAWRLKMEPRRIYKPVVADFHHFEKELDPNPDLHLSGKLDPDLHFSEKLDPNPDLH
jgi:hypothetical protein